jgi:hypothetical protein
MHEKNDTPAIQTGWKFHYFLNAYSTLQEKLTKHSDKIL